VKKARILLVEDDHDNMELVKFILERAGHTVFIAHDGLEALTVAHDMVPDLILMDMAMPEMDGWTASEKLKEDPVTKDITIVALTVRSQPEDKIRARNAGCDGYITKPMNVAEFVLKVAEFVREAQFFNGFDKSFDTGFGPMAPRKGDQP